ncbi:hypothetical protein C0Q70_04486 [Pomacea canaliculata]|uniref:TNFR-Cys domain-containing protein n=1 Tax=Pomacea canaliculata TaxID=400727 RepID=A0A2T7PII2_POMCA|nr:hypothetical protein C0Q70_04486 [Pomacea canaliculata]
MTISVPLALPKGTSADNPHLPVWMGDYTKAMTLSTSSLLTLVMLAIVTSPSLAAEQTANSAQPGYDADSARVDDDYGVSVEPCPPGHFLSAGEGQAPQCQLCSTCPTNQIIRRICSALEDTVCGPFYEFHDFHQSPNHGDPPAHASGSRSQQTQGSDDAAHGGRRLEPDMTSLDPTRDQWRHLTLILLTFLSVFCVVVVVFGVIICRLRKRQLREKQIVYEPGE